MTTPDDDPTAPVDLPFPGTPASGTSASPDVPAPPPPPSAAATPASGAADPAARPAAGPAAGTAAPASRPAVGRRTAAARVPHPARPRPSSSACCWSAWAGSCCSRGSPTSASAGDTWPLWLVVPGVACLVASFALPQRQAARARDRRHDRHDRRADPVGPGDLRRVLDVGLRVGARRAVRAGCRHAPLRRCEWRRRAGRAPGSGRRLVGLALFARVRAVLRGRHRPVGEPIAPSATCCRTPSSASASCSSSRRSSAATARKAAR